MLLPDNALHLTLMEVVLLLDAAQLPYESEHCAALLQVLLHPCSQGAQGHWWAVL
jgi:hypothetical protein